MGNHVYFSLISLILLVPFINGEQDTCESGSKKEEKYVLYNVNPGEGFNLRRDVYIRMANFVRKLNELDRWVLVLPPWGNLYHWKNMRRGIYVPWSKFFNVKSLGKWIPVMEFEDFIKNEGRKVDAIYLLQHYAEGWEGQWEEKFDERPCIEESPFVLLEDTRWHGRLWGTGIISQNFTCLSVQGQTSTLLPLFTQKNTRSILLGRSETVLHDEFGGRWFWSARRSMRFANHLIEEAKKFRRDYLDADDVRDKTDVPEDWRDHKPERGSAVGGPYISVHLRRRDFIYARGDEVPTLKNAAKQITKLLKSYDLEKVFIATDSPLEEIKELQQELKGYDVYHYSPSQEIFTEWGDGGVAIIDQIICAHARHFVGSYESTFSFRIQEEREILGFPVDTTFNRLCGKKSKCEQPAKWKIVF